MSNTYSWGEESIQALIWELPGLLTAAFYWLGVILWIAALLVIIRGRKNASNDRAEENIGAAAFGLSFIVIPALIFIIAPSMIYIFSLLRIDDFFGMLPDSIATGIAFLAFLSIWIAPVFLMIHFRKNESYKPRYSLRTVIIMLTLSFLTFSGPIALEALLYYPINF